MQRHELGIIHPVANSYPICLPIVCLVLTFLPTTSNLILGWGHGINTSGMFIHQFMGVTFWNYHHFEVTTRQEKIGDLLDRCKGRVDEEVLVWIQDWWYLKIYMDPDEN